MKPFEPKELVIHGEVFLRIGGGVIALKSISHITKSYEIDEFNGEGDVISVQIAMNNETHFNFTNPREINFVLNYFKMEPRVSKGFYPVKVV